MRKSQVFVSAVLCLFSLIVIGVRADTVLSNLAEPPSGANQAKVNQWVATSFTTDNATYQLSVVTLSMVRSGTTSPGGFFVGVYSDVGGRPGGLVPGGGLIGSSNPEIAGLYTYTATGAILLPNTTYWVLVGTTGGTSDQWYAWSQTRSFITAGRFALGVLRISDDQGASWGPASLLSVGQFSVEATSTGNTPPVAQDQPISTQVDQPVNIQLNATDSDVPPQTLTYSIVSYPDPAKGTLSGTPPTVTYTPNSGFTGSDSFTFKANDGQDDSNVATVSITVGSSNQPPDANDDSITTDKDTPVDITLFATDPDGDNLTYSIVTGPAHGTLGPQAPVPGDPPGNPVNVTYTPLPGFVGSDSFTFKANDGQQDSNPATIWVTVNPVALDSSISEAHIAQVVWDPDINIPTDGRIDLVLGKAAVVKATLRSNGTDATDPTPITIELHDENSIPLYSTTVTLGELVSGAIAYLYFTPVKTGSPDFSLVLDPDKQVQDSDRSETSNKLPLHVTIKETLPLRLAYIPISNCSVQGGLQKPGTRYGPLLLMDSTVAGSSRFIFGTYPLFDFAWATLPVYITETPVGHRRQISIRPARRG